jgi:DNA-directed RNA polymerase specialized sigma24 family protein
LAKTEDTRIGGPDHRFPTTHLSAVLATRSDDAQLRQRALDALVAVYWKPIYKYIRLRSNKNNEDAKDLTQGFLARLIEKDFLESYDPARARLRTFLRVCLDRFIANDYKALERQKRGGDLASVDFDGAEAELSRASVQQRDWEAFFDHEWTRAIFEIALQRFRASCDATGRQLHCQLFERRDIDDAQPSYSELANEFGLKVTDVTNFLASARREFRTAVLDTLREMTGSDEEFRRECRSLLGVEPR